MTKQLCRIPKVLSWTASKTSSNVGSSVLMQEEATS